MTQKRLCIVTHTFLPHVGGIERVVYEQGKRLMRRGYDVTVLTSRMNTPETYTVNGIKVRCYDSLNAAFGLGIPYPIPQVNSFEPFYKSVNASDLIHVHGHPYVSSLFAAKLAKFTGKPVVLTQHNTFITYENGMWDHVEWLNDATIGKQALNTADRIVAVSEATRRYVFSLGANPARTTVIRNGVDIERFKPSSTERPKIRQKLDIPLDAIVVLTVRRLVNKNGIDTFVESAKIALKQNPNLVFLVVGTGPDKAAIQSQIQELNMTKQFKLAGFVPDSDLPSFYNSADLFVLPSKSGEGLPLVALEAMSCGLPVIATDVGGISEVVVQGGGTLIPADNPHEMAKVVLQTSQTDFSVAKVAVRTVAERSFDWEKNVESLTKIYEELI